MTLAQFDADILDGISFFVSLTPPASSAPGLWHGGCAHGARQSAARFRGVCSNQQHRKHCQRAKSLAAASTRSITQHHMPDSCLRLPCAELSGTFACSHLQAADKVVLWGDNYCSIEYTIHLLNILLITDIYSSLRSLMRHHSDRQPSPVCLDRRPSGHISYSGLQAADNVVLWGGNSSSVQLLLRHYPDVPAGKLVHADAEAFLMQYDSLYRCEQCCQVHLSPPCVRHGNTCATTLLSVCRLIVQHAQTLCAC